MHHHPAAGARFENHHSPRVSLSKSANAHADLVWKLLNIEL